MKLSKSDFEQIYYGLAWAKWEIERIPWINLEFCQAYIDVTEALKIVNKIKKGNP